MLVNDSVHMQTAGYLATCHLWLCRESFKIWNRYISTATDFLSFLAYWIFGFNMHFYFRSLSRCFFYWVSSKSRLQTSPHPVDAYCSSMRTSEHCFIVEITCVEISWYNASPNILMQLICGGSKGHRFIRFHFYLKKMVDSIKIGQITLRSKEGQRDCIC